VPVGLDDLQRVLTGPGRRGVEVQHDLGDVGQPGQKRRRVGVPLQQPVGDGALLVQARTQAQEQRQRGLRAPQSLHAGQVVEHVAGARAELLLDVGQLTVDLVHVGGILQPPHPGR
jgi:hypothetical protein